MIQEHFTAYDQEQAASNGFMTTSSEPSGTFTVFTFLMIIDVLFFESLFVCVHVLLPFRTSKVLHTQGKE